MLTHTDAFLAEGSLKEVILPKFGEKILLFEWSQQNDCRGDGAESQEGHAALVSTERLQ